MMRRTMKPRIAPAGGGYACWLDPRLGGAGRTPHEAWRAWMDVKPSARVIELERQLAEVNRQIAEIQCKALSA